MTGREHIPGGGEMDPVQEIHDIWKSQQVGMGMGNGGKTSQKDHPRDGRMTPASHMQCHIGEGFTSYS